MNVLPQARVAATVVGSVSRNVRATRIAQWKPCAIRAWSTSSNHSPSSLQAQASTSRPQPNLAQSSNASSSASASSSGKSKSNGKDKEGEKKPLIKPRNDSIPFPVVTLVNPETGSLDPPARLRDILEKVNRKTQYLELVQEKPQPIVKIISTKTQYDRAKAKQVQKVLGRAPEEKEVQLTWGVDASDLAFKLRKAREELEDGNRVTLVFAPKKKQPLPGPEEQKKIVEEAIRLLEDVGRERKERTAQKSMVALFMEGLRPKQVHNVKWDFKGDELWTGLKAVKAALQSNIRVDVVFTLPPPPKATKADPELQDQTVERAVVQKRLEDAISELTVLGRETKARDTRKTAVVLHLDPIPRESS